MPLSVHFTYQPKPEALAHLYTSLDAGIDLTFGPENSTVPDYHVLVAGRPTREQITASPNLHTLLIPFAGLPAVTRDLMHDFPQVAIHNVHHNASPTAEMAVALLLAAARYLVPSDRVFRGHDWTPRYQPYPSLLLAGKTALILGYGAVGQRVGAVCRALGMTVYGIRRRVNRAADNVYPLSALDDLLPRAHALMICLPGTADTTGLIGPGELARLPTGAVLVNVGRAAVVDEAALYDSLKTGHLHAAGLDVWYRYPADDGARANTPPSDYPFHELDNVIMSPHRAGGGGNPEIEQMRMAAVAEMINRIARGDFLPHRVDLDAGY